MRSGEMGFFKEKRYRGEIMKKWAMKLLYIISAIILAAVISGCAAEEEAYPEMSIDCGTRADGSSYSVYNGDAQEYFGVAEGKENVVEISVKKESGYFRIIIHAEDEPDKVLYDGHDFPAESFTVTAREAGRYRILVHAEDFIGTYHFSYDMTQ